VGRDVGRHSDRDSIRSVDQKIRNARGQNCGLRVGVVVGWLEVDCIFVDIGVEIFRHASEAALRVSHGRGRIVIDRAEISLTIDQGIAQRKWLRHANQSVIQSGVAMGMVFSHGLADNSGALHVPAIVQQAGVEHMVENATMHGLQTVAHIG